MDAGQPIRNQIMLMRGRGSDSLPGDNRELASLAELLGYGPGESSHLLADYRRVTRAEPGLSWTESSGVRDPQRGSAKPEARP